MLLEVEVRFPELVASARACVRGDGVRCSTAGSRCSSCSGRVHGMWFDAYDALLWLIAFATLELDVMRGSGRGLSAPDGRLYAARKPR